MEVKEGNSRAPHGLLPYALGEHQLYVSVVGGDDNHESLHRYWDGHGVLWSDVIDVVHTLCDQSHHDGCGGCLCDEKESEYGCGVPGCCA